MAGNARTRVWLEAQPGQGQAEPAFVQPPVLERSGLGGGGARGDFSESSGLKRWVKGVLAMCGASYIIGSKCSEVKGPQVCLG